MACFGGAAELSNEIPGRRIGWLILMGDIFVRDIVRGAKWQVSEGQWHNSDCRRDNNVRQAIVGLTMAACLLSG